MKTRLKVALQAAMATFALGLTMAEAHAQAQAQKYPDKPIRLIVPYSAGGGVDGLARFLVPEIQAALKQPVIVDNRPGANGFIGMNACAKAPPDGYTLCLTVPDVLTHSPYLYTNIPYDSAKDFVGVTNLVEVGTLIYSHPHVPWKDATEMVAYAKSHPGTVNFGTWGPGSVPDLLVRYMNLELGTAMTAINYKGAALILNDVLGEQIQIGVHGVGAMAGNVASGRIKPMAVFGSRRSKYLPDVPALSEIRADVGINNYFAVFAPANTPPDIVDRLYREFNAPLKSAAGAQYLEKQGLEYIGLGPDDFQRSLVSQREDAGRLMNRLGIKPMDAPQ